MSATFTAYIDESGDEGFQFGKGSSEWFVLAAAVVRRENEHELLDLADGVQTTLGRDPGDHKPLHFRDMRHEQRLVYIDRIARADLRVFAVLLHKPSLAEPEKFRERYRLYFYHVKLLCERLSWYCRDHRPAHDAHDGTVNIVFSNRSGMRYQEMSEYLARLEAQPPATTTGMVWSVVRPNQISALTAGKRVGLQIADAVAGSFWYAVQSSQYGFTEPRYANMLWPVVYHNRGTHLGYGVKVCPREVDGEQVLERITGRPMGTP